MNTFLNNSDYKTDPYNLPYISKPITAGLKDKFCTIAVLQNH